MRKELMTGLLAAFALAAAAQSNEWQDPEVNAVNRAPMRAHFFAYENADMAARAEKELSENFMTLNGTWKFSAGVIPGGDSTGYFPLALSLGGDSTGYFSLALSPSGENEDWRRNKRPEGFYKKSMKKNER